MTLVTRHQITVVPNSASAADVLSSAVLSGLVYAVGFQPSTVNPWSSLVDFNVTVEGGADILHVDLASGGEQLFWPRRRANTTASGFFETLGTASGFVDTMVPLAGQRVRVVASSGGATTSGTVNIYLMS